MGALIAKTLLQLMAAAVLLAIGFSFPNALANALSWLDAVFASLADNAEPTGTIKLILQFAGAGFAVLTAALVMAVGFAMRQFVSETIFHWRYVLTAGLIPLIAHVVKWGLGLWWPALLVPAHTLTGAIYNWFSAETQVQLDLFNFKGHMLTIIVSLGLLMLWSLITILWRLIRRRSQPPSGNTRSRFMSIFTKPYNWVRSKFRKNPAPAPATPPTPQPPSGNRSNAMNRLLKLGWRFVTLPFRLVWKFLKWAFIRDIIFGPITWTTFLIALAVGLGYGLSLTLEWLSALLVQSAYLSQNPFTGSMRVLVQIIVTAIFVLPHWEQEKVTSTDGEEVTTENAKWKLKTVEVPPPARGMPLSWIGIMTPIILSSGKYPLFGEWLGFGRVDIESTTIAKKNFLVLSDVTFTVWQTPTEATSSITLQAGNGATVTGNLSFILKGRRRMRWEEAADAGTQLGNRARQELQEIIENFVDTDVKSIQGVMSRLMRGAAMLTGFLPKEVGGRKAGSMVRDKSGKPLYVFVEDFLDEEEARANLQEKLKSVGDETLVAGLGKDDEGKYLITKIQAEKPVTEVIEFLGWKLKEVIYDSVRASEIVEEVSNKASSEEKQREIQIASARTAAAAAREQTLTEDEKANLSPLEQAAMLENQRIQQAIDSPNGNVRFIQIAGGSTQRLSDLVAADAINNKGSDKT